MRCYLLCAAIREHGFVESNIFRLNSISDDDLLQDIVDVFDCCYIIRFHEPVLYLKNQCMKQWKTSLITQNISSKNKDDKLIYSKFLFCSCKTQSQNDKDVTEDVFIVSKIEDFPNKFMPTVVYLGYCRDSFLYNNESDKYSAEFKLFTSKLVCIISKSQ